MSPDSCARKRAARRLARSCRKKSRSISLHSSPRTPDTTGKRWFKRASCERFSRLPMNPALGSKQPKTQRATRACTMAPAHIGQGSKVTYTSHSSRRQSPITRAASRIASSSAWAVGSWSMLRRLWAFAMMAPWCTTTDPTGTSPRSVPKRACSIAATMNDSSRDRPSTVDMEPLNTPSTGVNQMETTLRKTVRSSEASFAKHPEQGCGGRPEVCTPRPPDSPWRGRQLLSASPSVKHPSPHNRPHASISPPRPPPRRRSPDSTAGPCCAG